MTKKYSCDSACQSFHFIMSFRSLETGHKEANAAMTTSSALNVRTKAGPGVRQDEVLWQKAAP